MGSEMCIRDSVFAAALSSDVLLCATYSVFCLEPSLCLCAAVTADIFLFLFLTIDFQWAVYDARKHHTPPIINDRKLLPYYLDDTHINHGICNLNKAGNISANHVVTGESKLLCSGNCSIVDAYHNRVQTLVSLFK